MRITTQEQLDAVAETIGDQNLHAATRLLADGGQMWFFRSSEEVQTCDDLTFAERNSANRNISDFGWAAITRSVPQEIPHPSDRLFAGFRDTGFVGHGPGNWCH